MISRTNDTEEFSWIDQSKNDHFDKNNYDIQKIKMMERIKMQIIKVFLL